MFDKLFKDHPRAIGESYGEHAGHAVYIGVRMIGAGVACLVHALLPGLFVRTASETVDDIQDLMTRRSASSRLGERTA
ncbi:MAG: DUF6356 family protein [Pseudomonadales bacterium]|jgi:hypothetical protein